MGSQTTFMYQPSVKHNLSKFLLEHSLVLLFDICYPELNVINGPESQGALCAASCRLIRQ